MLHFLVMLKISFGAKFFSAFITLYVLMACFVHIKLPLVFKDVGLFRAFSTDTNELSIPTRCVLCLLMVHQISLYYLRVLTIPSHPIFCARFLNHWTIMHAILFLIFSAAQFWTLSDVWRWATENFTTFGNWKRATEIARKFKKMSNGEFCNFGALKKSCGD